MDWIPADQQTLVFGIAGLVALIGPALFLVYRRLFDRSGDTQEIELQDHSPTEEIEVSVKLDEAEPVQEVVPEPVSEEKPEPVKEVPRKDLKEALGNTRNTLFGRIKGIFSSDQTLGDDELEELEEVLYTSDIGPNTVQRLVESVSEKMQSEDKSNFDAVRAALKTEMMDIFGEVDNDDRKDFDSMIAKIDESKPQVWMIVGVNGAGKTTSIGKLAHRAASQGKKTMVVAGDTFRAAAGDQLKVWTDRAGVEIFSPEGVSDPSAVAFDAIQSAKAKDYDLVIVDTAGRLHTQDNLMEELKKMQRVIQKHMEEAPHETLIVLDSNSGQNALIQTEKFHEALGLTGAVLTKLDGSAKGGVAIGLASQFQLPIKMIGVGEGMEDLRPFDAGEFVDSIL